MIIIKSEICSARKEAILRYAKCGLTKRMSQLDASSKKALVNDTTIKASLAQIGAGTKRRR
jgi:hypothetical protein